MKFYDCATAPSPRRVRIFLAEKGISIETVQVDLRNGEQFTDAFRAINPDCTVPALHARRRHRDRRRGRDLRLSRGVASRSAADRHERRRSARW